MEKKHIFVLIKFLLLQDPLLLLNPKKKKKQKKKKPKLKWVQCLCHSSGWTGSIQRCGKTRQITVKDRT